MTAVKYHVNDKGNVGVCKANIRDCEFGESSHYGSEAEAHAGYESKMSDKGLTNVSVKQALWETQKVPMFSRIERTYRAKTIGESVLRLKTEVETYRNAEKYSINDLLKDNGYDPYSEAIYKYETIEEADIENLTASVNTDMSSGYEEKFAFYKLSSTKKLLEKLDKKDKKYLFIKTSHDDYEKVLSDIPNGFEPVVFGDGDDFRANIMSVDHLKKGKIMVLVPSSETEKTFENKNAAFYRKLALEDAQKIIDNPNIPDWAALPLKDEVFSYRIRAYETRNAVARLNDFVKNHKEQLKQEQEEINKWNKISADYETISSKLEQVKLSDNDPVFTEWVNEQIKQQNHSLKYARTRLETIKENSVSKDSLGNRQSSVEFMNELDNEEEGEDISNALYNKSEALGIVGFNPRKWLKKNDNIDLFSLRGVRI